MRLIPYLLAMVVGFILALMMVSRLNAKRPGDPGSSGGKKRYRDLEKRYRDLTARLREFDDDNDFRANRLRRTLWDLRGMLANPESVTTERLQTAVEEIDRALAETGPASESGPAR